MNGTLSSDERERILNSEVLALTKAGWKLQSRTETSAQLHADTKKRLYTTGCVVAILTLGMSYLIEIPLRILYFAVKGPIKEHLLIEVLPDGRVEKTRG